MFNLFKKKKKKPKSNNLPKLPEVKDPPKMPDLKSKLGRSSIEGSGFEYGNFDYETS